MESGRAAATPPASAALDRLWTEAWTESRGNFTPHCRTTLIICGQRHDRKGCTPSSNTDRTRMRLFVFGSNLGLPSLLE